MIVLDGRALARQREAGIASRVEAVRTRRGHAPLLLLVAFADEHGVVPHVTAKTHAAERVGVRVQPLILHDGRTHDATLRLAAAVHARSYDAVFVQVPCPDGIEQDALLATIPASLDVDIMTPARTEAYLRGDENLPPVTVSGALALLDAHDLPVRGLRGLVVAEPSTYSDMIVEAFRRRGVIIDSPLAPDSAQLDARIAAAELVIAAAAQPGVIAGDSLPAGCIALDFGYFNAGARGDIDTTRGVDQLRALMPVPGGVGPMTVSALLERVVAFAER